jgi:hypothetical protein
MGYITRNKKRWKAARRAEKAEFMKSRQSGIRSLYLLVGVILFFLVIELILRGFSAPANIHGGLGILFIGTMFATMVAVEMKNGVVTRYGVFGGTYYRDRNPVGFWYHILFWSAVSFVLLGVGIVIMLHLID